MYRAYKYRLMPTAAQATLINKHIGACRFVYNLGLEVKTYAYNTQRVNVSGFALMRQLTELKKDIEWFRELDSQALIQSLANLDTAFNGFFKGNASYPKFKNKYTGRSFRHPNGKVIKIKDGRLIQAKFMEGIPVIIDRPLKGQIRQSTISRTPTNKYYVSILVDDGERQPSKPIPGAVGAIGIDLGLKAFLVTSKGLKIEHPKYLRKQLSRLQFISRQHSKKKKGGKNRSKSRYKLALCHEKITNQRKDFLHKLSTQLVKSHDTLCFETLRVGNLLRNRTLSKSIQDSGWSAFIEMCSYKSDWYGKNFLQIPAFQASSKLCSNCQATNDLLTLADREWICSNCNSIHDRDVNAAINIKDIALNNCGGGCREKPVELPEYFGAEKQEANNIVSQSYKGGEALSLLNIK